MLWHPFADQRLAHQHELVIVRGEGCWVWDRTGRRYLDASAGLWYCNVGHGRLELAEAAMKQMRKLAAYQTFDALANEPALELAARICQLSPVDGAAAFFTNGGSDAVDTAAKMARRFWQLSGQPGRQVIVARSGAYHGTNGFGTSLAGIEANALGWGPMVREVEHVAHDSVEQVAAILEERGDEVAAFIGEPVLGAAGVYPPAGWYWRDVSDLCREHGVLLIADEVVTGFGRVGAWFASERYAIEPDLIVCAKGLTSGYMPAGAVIAGSRVRERLWSEAAGVFRHGYTYSGHPTACAVALANLDIIEREELIERARELEPRFGVTLGSLSDHPLVDVVRTEGMLAGIELSSEALGAAPDLAASVVSEARERGVLTRALVGRTLQISPPLVITEGEIDVLQDRLSSALDSVQNAAKLLHRAVPR